MKPKILRSGQQIVVVNPYQAARIIQMLESTKASVRLDLFRESIGPDNFDALLSDRMNKRLALGYKVWDSEWRKIVSIRKNVSMLTQYTVRMGEFANLNQLSTTGGTFLEMTPPSDDEISWSVGGWGNLIVADFQTKKTDDLDWFGKMAFTAGKAGIRTLHNWLFVTNLQSNPTVDDGNSLFDNTNHGNDSDSAGVGRALNYANLAASYEAMLGQTDINGAPIYVEGVYISCGVVNKINAKVLMESEYNPDTANREPNFFKGVIKGYVVSPYLGNDWYLHADPNISEGFEMGFLDDVDEPQLFYLDPDVSDEYFKTKNSMWRIESYFGGSWVSWQGVQRGSQDI